MVLEQQVIHVQKNEVATLPLYKKIKWILSKFQKKIVLQGHYQGSEKAAHRMEKVFFSQLSGKCILPRIYKEPYPFLKI